MGSFVGKYLVSTSFKGPSAMSLISITFKLISPLPLCLTLNGSEYISRGGRNRRVFSGFQQCSKNY